MQPMFLEVEIDMKLKVAPKLSVNKPIEDQDPFLSREELKSNIFIDILPEPENAMRTEKEIREEIFEKVVELYELRRSQARFIPGETRINYAGRVYDEKEMISLVDASLDFWLTTGRYAKQFEEELAKFIGVRYCLLTNSGSSANLLAISALTSPKLGEREIKTR